MEKNCNSNIDLDDREDIHIPSESMFDFFFLSTLVSIFNIFLL